MNKLALLAPLITAVSSLIAQETGSLLVQPSRMPTPSAWALVYRASPGKARPGSPTATTPQSSPPAPAEGPAKIRAIVDKADGMRRDQISWDNGIQTETWYVLGLVMQQIPTWPADQLMVKRVGADETAPDVSRTDFPELFWISPGSYMGLVKFGRGECHYFKSPEGQEAWLDSETLRPLEARVDKTTSWTYDYSAQPEANLEMSKVFSDRLIPFKKRLERFEEAKRQLLLQKQKRH